MDETVSFITNGQRVSGNLEGGDVTIGLGVSKSVGQILTLSGTASLITSSDYEFKRSRACADSTPELPRVCRDSEKVKRIDRNTYGLMATFTLTPSLHFIVTARSGGEDSVTSSLYLTF